jgi:pimeloyl-ACP methyl ester carboxylesterase
MAGNSIGGFISTSMAADYPDLVRCSALFHALFRELYAVHCTAALCCGLLGCPCWSLCTLAPATTPSPLAQVKGLVLLNSAGPIDKSYSDADWERQRAAKKPPPTWVVQVGARHVPRMLPAPSG